MIKSVKQCFDLNIVQINFDKSLNKKTLGYIKLEDVLFFKIFYFYYELFIRHIDILIYSNITMLFVIGF
jgi:hypothetical protein